MQSSQVCRQNPNNQFERFEQNHSLRKTHKIRGCTITCCKWTYPWSTFHQKIWIQRAPPNWNLKLRYRGQKGRGVCPWIPVCLFQQGSFFAGMWGQFLMDWNKYCDLGFHFDEAVNPLIVLFWRRLVQEAKREGVLDYHGVEVLLSKITSEKNHNWWSKGFQKCLKTSEILLMKRKPAIETNGETGHTFLANGICE